MYLSQERPYHLWRDWLPYESTLQETYEGEAERSMLPHLPVLVSEQEI